MSQRYITSIVAAIALAASAVLAFSGPAQAHMGARAANHYGWHYGWHKGWHPRSVAYAGDSCYQKQWVATVSGWRWEWVNTCDAGRGGLFGTGLLGF